MAYPKPAARDFSARDSAKEPVGHLLVAVGNHKYSLNVSEEKVSLRGVAEEHKRQQEQSAGSSRFAVRSLFD